MGSQTHRLGELQLRIMKVLWKSGSSGVAEIQGASKSNGGRPLGVYHRGHDAA